MVSSDEEEITPQRLEMEKKKSTHELLLVIFESMRENFKDHIELQTYRKLMRVLYEEKGQSDELKIALSKMREFVNNDSELGLKDKVLVMVESHGLFCSWNLKDPAQASKFEGKVLKLLQTEENHLEILLSLLELPSETVAFFNSSKEILKAIAALCKTVDLDLETSLKILAKFDLKVSGRLRTAVEEAKYDYRAVDIYLKKFLAEESNYQRLKYLDEFVRRLSDQSQKSGMSSLAKVEVQKKVIASVVEYLKNKDFGEDNDLDDEGKYKYIGQYLRVLISITKLNKELLEDLGETLTRRWFCFNAKDKAFVETVTEVFWPLKKQCPASLFLFILENSSTVGSLDTSTTRRPTLTLLFTSTRTIWISGSSDSSSRRILTMWKD